MTVQVSFYRHGIERLIPETWAARAADRALLIGGGTSWVFDVDDTSLLDLNIGATELTATNYARISLAPSAPVWSSPRWSLPLAALVWASLGTAEEVDAIIGFEFDTDDTNSKPLWAIWDDAGPLWTCDGSTVTYSTDLGVT